MNIVQIILLAVSIIIIFLGITSKKSIEKNSIEIKCEILGISIKEQSLSVKVLNENNLEIENSKIFCPNKNVIYVSTDNCANEEKKIEFQDLLVGDTILVNALNGKRFKVAKQVKVIKTTK